MMNITPVILCGGSGTRLWPLSRADYPKQFINLGDNVTLFQKTLNRIKLLAEKNNSIDKIKDDNIFNFEKEIGDLKILFKKIENDN